MLFICRKKEIKIAKYDKWLTDDKLLILEGWARDGLIDEQIAEKMDITPSTLYTWKKRFPEFSEALKKGKEVVDRQVENALLKRALGYDYEETTKEQLVNSAFQRMRGEDHVVELTESDWLLAQKYFDFECAYCGTKTDMTKDHLIPLGKGGELSKRNTIPCCRSCNSSKKDREFLMWYSSKPFFSEVRAAKIEHYITAMQLQYEKDINEQVAEDLHVTKVVTKHVSSDVTAAIFWLKNRKKEDWRDSQHMDYSGELNLNRNVMANISEEELRKLAAEIDENV